MSQPTKLLTAPNTQQCGLVICTVWVCVVISVFVSVCDLYSDKMIGKRKKTMVIINQKLEIIKKWNNKKIMCLQYGIGEQFVTFYNKTISYYSLLLPITVLLQWRK